MRCRIAGMCCDSVMTIAILSVLLRHLRTLDLKFKVPMKSTVYVAIVTSFIIYATTKYRVSDNTRLRGSTGKSTPALWEETTADEV